MKIWLDQVREEPFSWDETESVTLEALDRPEVLALGPVRWQGQVVYADPGYLLRGRLSYDQTLACDRCLKPTAIEAGADVELMIVVEPHGGHHRHSGGHSGGHGGEHGGQGEHAADAEERELLDSDLSVLVVAGDEFDTHDLILEQLQLNIPMKPLCRPDCPGLCPRCGADLAAGTCSCGGPEPDPRWAALASLKGRLAGSGGFGGSGGSNSSEDPETPAK